MTLKILYIGNKLSAHGRNISYMETLGPLLEKSGHQVSYASDKKNKGQRFVDMLVTLSRKRDQTDLVLIDTYSTLNYWYAIAVARLCVRFDIPYIPILHGGNLPARAKKSRKTFRFLINNAQTAICPSRYLEKSLSDLGYPNLKVIKNTIELADYDFKLRDTVEPKLLWVRSFSKIYNPLMAIEVFKNIKSKYADAQLCMIGPDKDGSLKETQDLAKSYGLEVEFTGRLSKEEWRARSKEFDIFINTTHFDNMPVSVLEAMALGLPVVSTNVGGLSYMLEDGKTAFLINDGDIKAMTDKVFRLIENPELSNKLSSNARKEVEKYSWDSVKLEWEKLLSEIENLL